MEETCSMDTDLSMINAMAAYEPVPAELWMWLLDKHPSLDLNELKDTIPSPTEQTVVADTSLHTMQACTFTSTHDVAITNTGPMQSTEFHHAPQHSYNQQDRSYETNSTTCMYSSSPDQSVPCCSPAYVHSDPACSSNTVYMQLDSSGETDHCSLESNSSGNRDYTGTSVQAQTYHDGLGTRYRIPMTYDELQPSEDSNESVELPSTIDLDVSSGLCDDIPEPRSKPTRTRNRNWSGVQDRDWSDIQACSQNHRLPSFNTILHKDGKKGRRGRPVTFPKPGCHYSSSEGESEEDDAASTYSNNSLSPSKRRGAKNVLLWKFLLEELSNPDETAHIQWVNAIEGSFRFVDTNETSRRWGAKKNKTDMNFEKLSRGIRHYYKDGLMSRQERTRLVYKFNWDRVPRAYRKW